MAVALSSLSFIQRSITTPSLAIRIRLSVGMPWTPVYDRDGVELRLHRRIVVRQLLDPAEDFRQIERFDRDARSLEQLLAEAHRVERGRPGADGADARVLQAVDDAAGGGEAPQIGSEGRVAGRDGVQRRQRIADAVLAQVVADRHLAAEAVAAVLDRHAARRRR